MLMGFWSPVFYLIFAYTITEISDAGITTFNTEKWSSMLSRKMRPTKRQFCKFPLFLNATICNNVI